MIFLVGNGVKIVHWIRRLIGVNYLATLVKNMPDKEQYYADRENLVNMLNEQFTTQQALQALSEQFATQKTLLDALTEQSEVLNQRHQGYIPLNPGEKLRVLFLFQVSNLWPSWKTLWRACNDDELIDAKIVLTERRYLDCGLQFLNDARNFLIENDIPFITDSTFSLEKYLPHVVFMQTPYEDTLFSKYSLDILKSLGCRLAYIPYGLELGGGATNLRYQFNTAVHQQAWRIFARSERHQKMFAKYCSAGSAHVVVTGHPKIDQIKQVHDAYIDSSLINKINGRKVILWCPHFSIGNDQWSTFLSYSDYILNNFSHHDDLFLIVRPHPLLFSRLRDNEGWTEENIVDYTQAINNKPNSYFDTATNYIASFKLSDGILTDAGSFLLEYFATGKPVAYLHNPDGPGLNDDGDIINYLHVVNTEKDIDTFLAMIAKNEDPDKERRCEAISEYFYQNDQEIGLSIKNLLLSSINQYDRPLTETKKLNIKHEQAEEYWRNATTTYLASPEYYDKQEKAMYAVLSKLGSINSALDIGCGDGRFTHIISQYCKGIKAIDISSELIEKAKASLSSKSISFAVETLLEAQSCQRYQLISCMGVTSGLIDNEVFLRTVDLLIASCRPGGYVLMKDSLSLGIEQHTQPNEENYVAVYRNINDYLNCFLSRGCKLIDSQEIVSNPERKLINKLFLFVTTPVAITDVESQSIEFELAEMY